MPSSSHLLCLLITFRFLYAKPFSLQVRDDSSQGRWAMDLDFGSWESIYRMYLCVLSLVRECVLTHTDSMTVWPSSYIFVMEWCWVPWLDLEVAVGLYRIFVHVDLREWGKNSICTFPSSNVNQFDSIRIGKTGFTLLPWIILFLQSLYKSDRKFYTGGNDPGSGFWIYSIYFLRLVWDTQDSLLQFFNMIGW